MLHVRIYRGPRKSSPVFVNVGASETRCGEDVEQVVWQMELLPPFDTSFQNSLNSMSSSQNPTAFMIRSTNGCLGGDNIGYLLSGSRFAFSILPLHLSN